MQVLGRVINGNLGVAARIAALRRSSPEVSSEVPTLMAAFPILAVEATLAALASFTLVVPLGLPWWLPIIGLPAVGAASAGCGIPPCGRGESCGAAWRCSEV
jgi:hypothetical protein